MATVKTQVPFLFLMCDLLILRYYGYKLTSWGALMPVDVENEENWMVFIYLTVLIQV